MRENTLNDFMKSSMKKMKYIKKSDMYQTLPQLKQTSQNLCNKMQGLTRKEKKWGEQGFFY